MNREELGTGYYRFDLTGDPDEGEATRVAEIFNSASRTTDEELSQAIQAAAAAQQSQDGR